MAEGVSIRKQIADLLGYKSWAHLSTETRMSGSPEAVTAFMDPLLAKVKEGAARDLARLTKLKGGDLEASDVSFYSAKLLKESYARRGVPGIFVDSSLDTSIARRHAIAAASSRCLIRAGARGDRPKNQGVAGALRAHLAAEEGRC